MLYNTSQQLLQSNDKLTNQYRLTREPSEPDTSYTTKRDSTTAPAATDRLPVVVGYADARGQWHRDGSRHIEVPPVERPAEAMGVGL